MQKITGAFIAFLLVLPSAHILAQENNKPTHQFLDAKKKTTDELHARFYALLWNDDSIWHRNDFYMANKSPQLYGQYLDADCKLKNGLFISYYLNGKIQDSSHYENNKQEGLNTGWYDTGEREFVNHYHNGNLVDSCIAWYKKGIINQLIVADKNGTGTLQQFAEDGTKKNEGKLYNGKRNGDWTFKDNNNILSQIVKYDMDSTIKFTNYDQSGAEEKGYVFLEKGAEFQGGMMGWRRFLEHNLHYPQQSQEKRIQGVVRVQMVVDKSGKISDIKVLSAPDTFTAAEGERIIKLSPNWLPAIQHNRKVTYRFVQTITFALQ